MVMSEFTDSSLKMKVVLSFETSGRSYPTTLCNKPEDPLQYENKFATNKNPSALSFPMGNAVASRMISAVSFPVLCFLSVLVV
jgi:hypothetical protein